MFGACPLKGVKYSLPNLGNIFSSPILDGDSTHAVSIKVIYYEDVLVARRIFDRELTSLF